MYDKKANSLNKLLAGCELNAILIIAKLAKACNQLGLRLTKGKTDIWQRK
jgi:hypothetical protein